jgi:hypothetical protein
VIRLWCSPPLADISRVRCAGVCTHVCVPFPVCWCVCVFVCVFHFFPAGSNLQAYLQQVQLQQLQQQQQQQQLQQFLQLQQQVTGPAADSN